MQRSKADYLAISARGVLMGAADAVPGVSGGTIAFITGIYQELIDSIKQCGPKALMMLFKQGIAPTWQYVNGNFLLALLLGIVLSLFSLSHVVLYLLDNHGLLLWSFFFGLIFASTWTVIKQLSRWQARHVAVFGVGAILAYAVTSLPPSPVEPGLGMVFLSGMIAVCAMILPGISGSFILLLLGMYHYIFGAVKALELGLISVFVLGCVTGLLSFSRVLSWMFKHYRDLTLVLLGGFILGSLNKVWPWKHTLESMINRHGESVPVLQENVLPGTFVELTGQSAQLVPALGLMVVGGLAVLLLDYVGNRSTH